VADGEAEKAIGYLIFSEKVLPGTIERIHKKQISAIIHKIYTIIAIEHLRWCQGEGMIPRGHY
jgi:hypothetical protein